MNAPGRRELDPIWALVGFMCVAFLVVGAAYAYWALFAADELSRHERNPRAAIYARRDPRGYIVAADGSVLAESASDGGGFIRRYHEPSLAPLIGFVSERYGEAGLEMTFHSRLLALAKERPTWGSLQLTIDLHAQRVAVHALGGRRGVALLVEAEDGATLAYVSQPGFDANALADPKRQHVEWGLLDQDARDAALPVPLDRATWRVSRPGAVFFLVTAAALIECGIDPRERVPVSGPYQANETWADFYVHPSSGLTGHFDLAMALRHPEAVYFAAQAPRVGGECLAAVARRLGVGSPPGAEMPATLDPQLVPAAGRLGPLDRPTFVADTATGGGSLMSPVQVARVVAAVANGGFFVEPHFVRRETPTSPRVLAPSTAQLISSALMSDRREGLAMLTAEAFPGELTWAVGFTKSPRAKVVVVALEGESNAADARAIAVAILEAADLP